MVVLTPQGPLFHLLGFCLCPDCGMTCTGQPGPRYEQDSNHGVVAGSPRGFDRVCPYLLPLFLRSAWPAVAYTHTRVHTQMRVRTHTDTHTQTHTHAQQTPADPQQAWGHFKIMGWEWLIPTLATLPDNTKADLHHRPAGGACTLFTQP
jgi:hypothetical protein